jgi:hypothetical protein
MNGFQFASSLVTGLAWPLVVIVLVVLFRKHLADLIGRIKSYKGLGHELTFGDRLADAENSVEEAARNLPVDKDEPKLIEVGSNPLMREAEANPSFVVISSWEQVFSAINDLVRAALGDKHVHGPRGFTVSALRQLQENGLVSPEFVTATDDLADLRNKVAHGQHNPTPGEAITYARSAQVLTWTARMATAKLPGLAPLRRQS